MEPGVVRWGVVVNRYSVGSSTFPPTSLADATDQWQERRSIAAPIQSQSVYQVFFPRKVAACPPGCLRALSKCYTARDGRRLPSDAVLHVSLFLGGEREAGKNEVGENVFNRCFAWCELELAHGEARCEEEEEAGVSMARSVTATSALCNPLAEMDFASVMSSMSSVSRSSTSKHLVRDSLDTLWLLAKVHPTAFYEMGPGGKPWVYHYRKIVAEYIKAGDTKDDDDDGVNDDDADSTKKERRKTKDRDEEEELSTTAFSQRRDQVASFVPLGRRSVLRDSAVSRACEVETIHFMPIEMDGRGAGASRFIRSILAPRFQNMLTVELHASNSSTALLAMVYEDLRAGHKGMYLATLNGVKKNPQFSAFMRRTAQLQRGIENRKRRPSQAVQMRTLEKFSQERDLVSLYIGAHGIRAKFERLMSDLASKTGAVYLKASLKRPLRVYVKAMMYREEQRQNLGEGKADEDQDQLWSTARVLDVVRGGLSFTSMNAMLMCLELLAATTSDPYAQEEARRRGWDAEAAGIFDKVELVRIKNRFLNPTSGGWADCVVSLRWADDAGAHQCEVQFIHTQLMLVRKKMGAHLQYEQFRSAMELLEATGNAHVVSRLDSEAEALRLEEEEEEKEEEKEAPGVGDTAWGQRVAALELAVAGQTRAMRRLEEENRELRETVALLASKLI
jgi:hypothetical protein